MNQLLSTPITHCYYKMSEYFKYYDDFGFKPESYHFVTPDRYPNDIKRIMSSGNHTFHKRVYFFSPSHRIVYKSCYGPLNYQVRWNSHVYGLIDDMNKRCSFCVNDRLIDRTSDMSKIELKSKWIIIIFDLRTTFLWKIIVVVTFNFTPKGRSFFCVSKPILTK